MEAELDLGEVCVIGGGATGALTALELQNAGVETTLVDGQGFAAGQSGHSHGYLHRGYIYRHGEATLIAHLSRGADAWKALLEQANQQPLADHAHVCFANEMDARAAQSGWRASGLKVEKLVACPPALREREVEAVYRTDEATYDFTGFFEWVSTSGVVGRSLRAHVSRLHRRGDRVVAADAMVDGLKVRLRASLFVLAAGDANAALAETATRYRGRAVVRTSLMVVLASRSLEPLTTVMPGNESHGLFIVSRALDERCVWLGSNFVSFDGGHAGTECSDLWLHAMIEKLGTFCIGVRQPDVLWGLYEAPKAELRAQPGTLGAHALEDYATVNLLVLAPTKLTLAPLLAAEAADQARERLTMTSQQRAGETPLGAALSVLPERWLSADLLPRDEFFSGKQRANSLSFLQRYGRPRSSVI